MPYPNSPEKHDWKALITPQASLNYFHDEPEPAPESLVLCFYDGLLDHIGENHAVTTFETWDMDTRSTPPTGGSGSFAFRGSARR